MHDLVLRGGRIADGTGQDTFTGDVAVQDGRIVEVGRVEGRGRREIDADGRLVTPGFVDIHTHYDAQATWDPHLLPSGWHGVTTAVVGNCGVGFAPAKPEQREMLISLMEGVEDIPGSALAEGIRWEWETFPEYLDALERSDMAIDLGTHVPHGSVRTYVMGERGARNEAATADDIARMAAIVKEGIAAGALGFSTSRTLGHRALDGEPVPGTFAQEDELFGIGRALGELGEGVFELAAAGAAGDMGGDAIDSALREIEWMERLSKEIRRPVSFAMLQFDSAPNQWRELVAICEKTRSKGADLLAQFAPRPFGILTGHQTEANQFLNRPAYLEIAHLPLPERVARLKDPAVRARILGPERDDRAGFGSMLDDPNMQKKIFPLGDPPDYEPGPEKSIWAIAQREGRSADEVLYDYMLRDEGRELLLLTFFNYSDGNLDLMYELINNDRAVVSLGDGGAHCGVICDASLQTFMLTHWVRDRKRGPKVPLEQAVARMTRDTARVYGLLDRGVIAPGYKADFNVIDFDNLALLRPEMAFDLPGGARRLLQRARGYDATIVSGEVTMEKGEATGARPGRLLRGAQPAPA
ncbi:MAG: amidohydrolase family protein [Spirochaetaceae bacterium]|nr:amidohydrolase family protein [Myxococcales bacterium]MCB9725991.1 amidohydrolase family protein [Spirochaetaceae bacterium]